MTTHDDVRRAYAARAGEYTEVLGSLDAMAAEDRQLIASWARNLDGPIVDAGCGPGHWTKLLWDIGADVVGVDVVQEFLNGAAGRFPDVPFQNASIADLPFQEGSLAGVLCWYSVIHTSPADVPGVLSEFARCLRPGGALLMGFFEGERVEPFEHKVVTAYYWPVSEMRNMLEASGFEPGDTHTRADPGHRRHAAILVRRRG